MVDKIADVIGHVEVEGNSRGGYSIIIGPKLVIMLLIFAISLGVWNSFELRIMSNNLMTFIDKQNIILEQYRRQNPNNFF
jgi:hypothetical protein